MTVSSPFTPAPHPKDGRDLSNHFPLQDVDLAVLRKRADKIIKSSEDSVRRLKILQAEIEERMENQRPDAVCGLGGAGRPGEPPKG
jgi:hypothetical protein